MATHLSTLSRGDYGPLGRHSACRRPVSRVSAVNSDVPVRNGVLRRRFSDGTGSCLIEPVYGHTACWTTYRHQMWNSYHRPTDYDVPSSSDCPISAGESSAESRPLSRIAHSRGRAIHRPGGLPVNGSSYPCPPPPVMPYSVAPPPPPPPWDVPLFCPTDWWMAHTMWRRQQCSIERQKRLRRHPSTLLAAEMRRLEERSLGHSPKASPPLPSQVPPNPFMIPAVTTKARATSGPEKPQPATERRQWEDLRSAVRHCFLSDLATTTTTVPAPPRFEEEEAPTAKAVTTTTTGVVSPHVAAVPMPSHPVPPPTSHHTFPPPSHTVPPPTFPPPPTEAVPLSRRRPLLLPPGLVPEQQPPPRLIERPPGGGSRSAVSEMLLGMIQRVVQATSEDEEEVEQPRKSSDENTSGSCTAPSKQELPPPPPRVLHKTVKEQPTAAATRKPGKTTTTPEAASPKRYQILRRQQPLPHQKKEPSGPPTVNEPPGVKKQPRRSSPPQTKLVPAAAPIPLLAPLTKQHRQLLARGDPASVALWTQPSSSAASAGGPVSTSGKQQRRFPQRRASTCDGPGFMTPAEKGFVLHVMLSQMAKNPDQVPPRVSSQMAKPAVWTTTELKSQTSDISQIKKFGKIGYSTVRQPRALISVGEAVQPNSSSDEEEDEGGPPPRGSSADDKTGLGQRRHQALKSLETEATESRVSAAELPPTVMTLLKKGREMYPTCKDARARIQSLHSQQQEEGGTAEPGPDPVVFRVIELLCSLMVQLCDTDWGLTTYPPTRYRSLRHLGAYRDDCLGRLFFWTTGIHVPAAGAFGTCPYPPGTASPSGTIHEAAVECLTHLATFLSDDPETGLPDDHPAPDLACSLFLVGAVMKVNKGRKLLRRLLLVLQWPIAVVLATLLRVAGVLALGEAQEDGRITTLTEAVLYTLTSLTETASETEATSCLFCQTHGPGDAFERVMESQTALRRNPDRHTRGHLKLSSAFDSVCRHLATVSQPS